MALTLPYPTLSATSDKNEIEQNFTTVANKFGSIINADISSAASLDITKLSAYQHEIIISTRLTGTELNMAGTTLHMVGGIPYDATQGEVTYTIVAIEHATYLVASATTAAVFTLIYGSHASSINIKTGITVGETVVAPRTTNVDAGGAAQALSSFTTTATTLSSGPRFFMLDVTTQGVGYDAVDSWQISIKLKRQLRS